MFKCIGCGLAILALLLGVLSPAEACGRWRCRHRSCTVCPPPSIVCRSPDEQAVQVYGGPEYDLDLATSIAKAALQVSLDKNLSDAARKALLAEFQIQIGDVALLTDTLQQLVGDGREIGRRDFLRFIGGEVRLIANRLPR